MDSGAPPSANQGYTPPDLEQLLRMGVSAARAGNRNAAYGLFRALVREYPTEPRAWLGLAGVAQTRDEQRAALEQVLALDPQNAFAQQSLARIGDPPTPASEPPAPAAERITRVLPETRAASAPEPPVVAAPAATAPLAPPPTAVERRPFPLLNLLAGLALVLLLGSVALLVGRALLGTGQPAAALPTAVFSAPTLSSVPLPATTSAPSPALSASPSPSLSKTSAPTAIITVPTSPPPTADGRGAPGVVALGTVLSADGWNAILLRSDLALLLDGPIGELAPRGRFLLALIAVSNTAATPRTLPADLFVLVDSRGRTYRPAPGASTAYLNTYGRAQRGDQAFEEQIEASSGMRSVPLIFDVPADGSAFVLTMPGAGNAGWPIGSDPPGAPAGP